MTCFDENGNVQDIGLYPSPISADVLRLQQEINNIYMMWNERLFGFVVRRRVWWKPWTWARKSVFIPGVR
jgi:hypothetical protein